MLKKTLKLFIIPLLFIAAFNSYGKTLEKPYVSFKVEGKKIALTFDDGPNPNTTKGILRV
jgi:peptidoglycan/xylan/chitin deacetylase (PgdA/CDA1 family)